MRARRNLAERFWEKVDRRGRDECWEWQSALRGGYGAISIGHDRKEQAHRLAYRLHSGIDELPSHMVVMHTCDNPICCNPNHLLLGTQRANLRDRNRKGRNIVPVRSGGKWTGKHRRA